MRALKIETPTLLFVLILAGLAIPRTAAGQAAVSPYDKRPRAGMMSADEVLILTYDVGDLILDVPDYPYPGSAGNASPFGGSNNAGMGGMGGMGGVMGGGMGVMMGGGAMPGGDGAESEGGGAARDRNSLPGSTKITMEDLKRVLTTVIAPDTWAENGGEEGELQCLGTSLVVRQTAVVHKQIEDLLEQLRKGSGKQRTVAVDARWLLLNSDELEKLFLAGENGQTRGVDRQILGEFTRRPSSIRGRTNCFTGQLVYLVSGTRRNVVTSFIPVVGSLERPQTGQYAALPGGAHLLPVQMGQSSRAVGYQPVIETPNLGVLLQIRPTLIPGDDRAIVDLRSTLTVLGKSSSEIEESVQSQQDLLVPKVDRVAIETQELATTLSVPLGEPVLAGGLTYIGPSADALRQEADANREQPLPEAPQLYLILELRQAG